MISYASSLFSTLFRFGVFVFLRIVRSLGPVNDPHWLTPYTAQIPTSLATLILPTLYSLYVSALYLSSNEDDLSKAGGERPKKQAGHVGPHFYPVNGFLTRTTSHLPRNWPL